MAHAPDPLNTILQTKERQGEEEALLQLHLRQDSEHSIHNIMLPPQLTSTPSKDACSAAALYCTSAEHTTQRC